MRKPWIDTAEIVARYRAGEGVRRIAEALGCSASAVHHRLVAAGVETRPPGPAPLALDAAELESLYLSGLTVPEVAARVGCGRTAVRARLRRRGTPMRPQGTRGRRRAADT